MSHYEQKEFVKIVTDNIKYKNINFPNYNILEIGSYDVGGSVKPFFKDCSEYVGVDLVEGPNVDIVLNGDEIDKLKKKFDIIISCECFEHAKNWKDIFQKMYEQTNMNGYTIFTCASRGRIEHGTSRTINSDSPGTDMTYYSNVFCSDFAKAFDLKKMFKNYLLFYNLRSSDLYFVGSKANSKDLDWNTLNTKLKNINNPNRKIKLFRIILSYLLNDKYYQSLTFLRRRLKKKIKFFF